MQERISYVAGPYKDYCGRAEYDEESRIFHGEVIGTRDVVTFQAADLSDLGKAFRGSVDDYLSYCAELGQEPEKPFSGKFVTRIPPEVHKRISILADAAGKSLNQFICDCLVEMTKPSAALCQLGSRAPQRRRTKSKRATVAKTRKAKPRQKEYT